MGNYFSHSNGSKSKKKKTQGGITEVDRAILSLKTQRRKLEDQGTLIEKRIEHNLTVAKELIAAQKKERALLALKKKKMNEQQLQSLQAWLINVEDMCNNMELRQQQNKIFTALKQGNDALKSLQKEFTLEDVEKLKDDTAEAKAYQDEISAALSEALTEEDTEAVEAELAALEAEAAGLEVADLPAVPITKVEVQQPAAAEKEGEEEEQEAAGVEALREAAKERGRPLLAEEPMAA